MKSAALLKLVLNILEEHKAIDIIDLNVQKLTDVTDYMVICSGTSSRHVHSIASNLVTKIKQHEIRPLGVEKDTDGTWTLVDLNDVIVHIMLPETRELYALEELWGQVLTLRHKCTNVKT